MELGRACDRALGEAGYRSGGARRRVVELLAGESCAVTALEIDRRLEGVGRASVYRSLEQLEELGLVQRVDLGTDSAGYERVDPGGATTITSSASAAARSRRSATSASRGRSSRSAGQSEFEVSAHEVVLRGECPDARREA